MINGLFSFLLFQRRRRSSNRTQRVTLTLNRRISTFSRRTNGRTRFRLEFVEVKENARRISPDKRSKKKKQVRVPVDPDAENGRKEKKKEKFFARGREKIQKRKSTINNRKVEEIRRWKNSFIFNEDSTFWNFVSTERSQRDFSRAKRFSPLPFSSSPFSFLFLMFRRSTRTFFSSSNFLRLFHIFSSRKLSLDSIRWAPEKSTLI